MKEYQIPRDLYIECKNNLELNMKQNKETQQFIDDLPQKLRKEFILKIYEVKYINIKFLQNKP